MIAFVVSVSTSYTRCVRLALRFEREPSMLC